MGRCHHSEEEIALALEGTWRPEHLSELRQARETCTGIHHRQITECDQEIEAELASSRTGGEKTRTASRVRVVTKSNDVRFEATGPLFQALILVDKNQGNRRGNGLVILAEIGVDVSRFPTESTSRVGENAVLCPTQG